MHKILFILPFVFFIFYSSEFPDHTYPSQFVLILIQVFIDPKSDEFTCEKNKDPCSIRACQCDVELVNNLVLAAGDERNDKITRIYTFAIWNLGSLITFFTCTYNDVINVYCSTRQVFFSSQVRKNVRHYCIWPAKFLFFSR